VWYNVVEEFPKSQAREICRNFSARQAAKEGGRTIRLLQGTTKEADKMIASLTAKRMIRSNFALMNRDDCDVDSLLANWADDAVWDGTSELGVGSTIKGKKAIAEWFRKWIEEFPKRNFVVRNICFGAWPLSPTNVFTVEWSLTQTNKEGREFKYDGVTVVHTRSFRTVRASEYISFAGLPDLSTLLK
jgi:ketosteroid isomerase-like protein